MKSSVFVSSLAVTAVASGFIGYATAQQAARNPSSGLHNTDLAQVDLGKHFEALKGKRLDMHRVIVDPGAGSKDHSHMERPEVFYVLKGKIVETQGTDAHEYKAGEGFQSNAKMYQGVPHRIENLSSEPAEVLVIEITSNPTR